MPLRNRGSIFTIHCIGMYDRYYPGTPARYLHNSLLFSSGKILIMSDIAWAGTLIYNTYKKINPCQMIHRWVLCSDVISPGAMNAPLVVYQDVLPLLINTYTCGFEHSVWYFVQLSFTFVKNYQTRERFPDSLLAIISAWPGMTRTDVKTEH